MKPKRTTSKLSDSVHRQVNMYAIAAGAAGVSLLALAQPSEARIVYTRANIQILPGPSYNLDINHDGITDFTIYDSRQHSINICDRNNKKDRLSVGASHGNGIEGNGDAAALAKGTRIGHSQGFQSGLELMASHGYGRRLGTNHRCFTFNFYDGNWVNVTDRYLGLKLIIHGKARYGWARLSVQIVKGTGIVATLTGYAYETIPGKSIIAGRTKGPADEWDQDEFGPDALFANPSQEMPQAASLGMLALGAPAMPRWRRREEAAVKGI